MQLDYTITSLEERKSIINDILSKSEPSAAQLESFADYLLMCKKEKKDKSILTDNRLTTIHKRETSYEGLAENLTGGEDTLYNLIKSDKNAYLSPKKTLTKDRINQFAETRAIQEVIDKMREARSKTNSSYQAYLLRKAIIELYQDLYVVYNALTQPINTTPSFQTFSPVHFYGFSLSDPAVVEAILCNYSHLKENGQGNFLSDTWYLMEDFDRIASICLPQKPHYELIVKLKIDGKTNEQIQYALQTTLGLSYNKEYISSLWRNRIPAYIADCAQRDYYQWLYTNVVDKPKKRCTRCGELKLATTDYFCRDASKKDGFYTICKECRKKGRKKQNEKDM